VAIKELIDFSTFTDLRTSKDLYANSIRKGLGYNAFGNQTKFQAIVISDPIPFSPEDLKYFNGDVGPLDRAWNNISNTTTQFSYRARIMGDNSPHSFLPDPCDSTYAADSEEVLKIIAMHTLFVSNEEGGGANSVPRLGSKVEVELTKNVFGYNLQFGKHSKLVANPEPSTASADACDTLVSAMASATGDPMWSYESGENSGGPPLDNPQVQEIYNAYLSKYGTELAPPTGMCGNLPGFPLEKCKKGVIGTRSVTLHPKFFDIVKQKYDMVKAQNFGEKFNGGSSIRTIETQISLRIKNAAKAGNELSLDQYIRGRSSLCNPPTAPLPTGPGKGSRHIYGCAIDFGGILSAGGTRVAKLPDSTARKSKTYQFLLGLQESGFKNYSAEPWHWSVDGH